MKVQPHDDSDALGFTAGDFLLGCLMFAFGVYFTIYDAIVDGWRRVTVKDPL